jgi:hypothetical protein
VKGSLSRELSNVSAGAKTVFLLQVTAIASAFVVFLFVYGFSIGLGFISDDFGWIRMSQVHSVHDAVALFANVNGFYRPLVSLTFSVDFALFGMHSLGYGLTNLALALACALLIVLLARRIGLGPVSWLPAAIWLLNFHGINMALLWISGRTSLLVTLFALASTLALAEGWTALSISALLLALLSKEEAIMLPVVLVLWALVGISKHSARARSRLPLLIVGSCCALAIYALARYHSGAVTPGTAPSYYRFTFSPLALIRNAAEYADRACTFPLLVCLVAWGISRTRPPSLSWSTVVLGLSWLVGFYALTLFLPVRSSLYSVLPSIGAALIAGHFVGAIWCRLDARRRQEALFVATVLPILLSPIYVVRNERWTGLARYSSSVLSGLSWDLQRAEPHSWVVLIDNDRGNRVNVQSAFGALVGDALSLQAAKPINVWVEPPLSTASLAGMRPPCDTCPVLRRTVVNGRIQ